ncbi:MAG: DNA polymerase IV [Anaerolineaceae bacterium]|nr:DNA polymerase IV [Anaerolineaceae bacterium]
MARMTRSILHLDLDAFFCAVEELNDPSLTGKAFAVGGQPGKRGVVASCSWPARRYGVRSGMPMGEALRLCPQLLVVSHSFGNYGELSARVMSLAHELTPRVEPVSIDEAFLDITGLPGDPALIARALQARIQRQLNLPCSIGGGSNKLIAKMATNAAKGAGSGDAPPRAIKVIPPGAEADFLAPLAVENLWGCGPKMTESLREMGVTTIGELASRPVRDLIRRFGEFGYDLGQHARGIDERIVESTFVTKSVGHSSTFLRDQREALPIRRKLRDLVERVGLRLRRQHLRGKTVTLTLRWSDFTTVMHQTTLPMAVNDDLLIWRAAEALFDSYWPRGRPLRLVGVRVSGLEPDRAGRQLELWEAPRELALQAAMDNIRNRFGDGSLRRCSAMDKSDSYGGPTPVFRMNNGRGGSAARA